MKFKFNEIDGWINEALVKNLIRIEIKETTFDKNLTNFIYPKKTWPNNISTIFISLFVGGTCILLFCVEL